MASIDKFCERMRYWCDEGNLGYDQYQRWNIYEGGECDCSSLVIFALREAGFDTGDATYTGNMSSNLTARGWIRVSPDGNPQRGDILLNDANHVAAWLGDCLAQASIDENGDIVGGQSGDQSGWETNTRGYYSYPWDCYLRYVGSQDVASYDGDVGDGVVYEVHTDDGWLGSVNRCDETESGYAGWNGKPIDGIRAYRADGRPLRIQAIMDGGNEWSWTEFNGSMWGENSDGDGYAGDIGSGHFIIGLRVFGAKCRVDAGAGYLGWTEGDNPTPEGDDFAGEDLWKKLPIRAVQMKL